MGITRFEEAVSREFELGGRSHWRAGIVAAVAALVLLAGCGNSRTPVPSIAGPAAPDGFHWITFPTVRMALAAPNSWTESPRGGRLLTGLSSGPAVVAVWVYRAAAPPPATRAALVARREALIRAVRARDPSVKLIRARILMLAGVHAIELDAFERIGGQLRRVRSTHLYAGTREIVLDEYAPPQLFHSVDHAVFSPLKRSVVLSPALGKAA